jgi:hypothetical protein
VPVDDIFGGYRGEHYPTFAEVVELDDGGRACIGHRNRVTSTWTWAIPSPDVLDYMTDVLNGRPVVELGAGNGYWAWMLSQYGIDVNAYDIAPIGHADSWFSRKKKDQLLDETDWKDDHPPREFHPVKKGSIEVLRKRVNANRVLFLCWPPYSSDFAYQAVKEFQGDTVIYIGEPAGGCTADWKFFGLMEGIDDRWGDDDEPIPGQEWERIGHVPLVQWSGIHDALYVYRRIQ